MATEIKLRRGTKAQHDDGSGFTGALGEVTVDTTDDTLRVHDGSLKGGHVLAKLSDVEASDTLAELSDTSITSTAAGHILIHDGSDSFDNKAVSGAITINSSGVTTLESGQALTNLGGGSGTTFLRKDGTFATPTNTTYSIQDGELSQNNFTDADHSKLNAIEASADVTDTTNVVAALTAGTNVSIAGDGTISSTDTNTTYSVQDGELSQNSFTNDDHSKLNGIEASADVTDTANVVAALTAGTNIAIAGNGTISATDTTYSVQDGELSQNNFTNDDHTKLNNIEAGADVTDATNVVAALTAGTNIAIAGNGTISSTDTNTQYSGGTGLTLDGTTFNVDAAQTGITSVGTLSGLTTGATTVNGALIVNNDFMEVVSTTDSVSDMPILSLYRDAGATTNGDEIGGVRFFGNNASDEKTFYCGMYAEIKEGDDGGEIGELMFHVADNSGNTSAVTDVTAGIVGDTDPVMSLLYYQVNLRSDVNLNFQYGAGNYNYVNWDTGSNNTKLVADYSDDANITCTLPVATCTLSGEGLNQSSYRSGEIIETLRGYADGRTLTGQATTAGAARNIVLEDVTAEQVLSNSYAKVNGTEFDYYPPAGTKTVLVEYQIYIGYDGSDIDPVFHHKIDVDGTVITQTQSTTRQEYRGHVYSVSEAIITVDGSGDLASGNIDSWNAAKTFRVLGREFGASNNVALHRVRIHDGSASATIINEPKIKITAIG
tara:strand:+ start:13182 stop:15332 length:2151 start_codon:yes stop_codon:yes gene_type:complete